MRSVLTCEQAPDRSRRLEDGRKVRSRDGPSPARLLLLGSKQPTEQLPRTRNILSSARPTLRRVCREDRLAREDGVQAVATDRGVDGKGEGSERWGRVSRRRGRRHSRPVLIRLKYAQSMNSDTTLQELETGRNQARCQRDFGREAMAWQAHLDDLCVGPSIRLRGRAREGYQVQLSSTVLRADQHLR